MRCWFSGRMPAFQAGDKSSILLRRTEYEKQNLKFCFLYSVRRKATVPKHCCVRIERKTGTQEFPCKNWAHGFCKGTACRFFSGPRLRAEMKKVKLSNQQIRGFAIRSEP